MKRVTFLFVALLFAFLLVWSFPPQAGASKQNTGSNRPESDTKVKPAGFADDDRSPRVRAIMQPSFFQDLGIKQAVVSGETSEPAGDEVNGDDPDLPTKSFMRNRINKEEYLSLRGEFVSRLRGAEPSAPFDARLRGDAIIEMEEQERAMRQEARKSQGSLHTLAFPNWTELGPRPIPNGQSQQFPTPTVTTGRATAVVVDPANSNKVYLGTAQGGVWRSTDGGTTWTAIFDTAQSLSIGALALDPADSTILFVGTGENNFSGDCFEGVGLYRIKQVDTTPILEGPFNTRVTGTGTAGGAGLAFSGTGINKIAIDPNDHNKMFIGNGVARAGISGVQATGAFWGLYFTETAQAVTPTFSRVSTALGGGNGMVTDVVYEPASSANLLITIEDSFGLGAGSTSVGGIYRSTNANTAAVAGNVAPTFTLSLGLPIGVTSRLAINKVGAAVTVYAATSETPSTPACTAAGEGGRVRKSTDAGVTFTTILSAADGYCGGQCVYDSPITVDPTDANIVYLGGNARGTCADVLKQSTDGGTTFTRDDTGLHADSHALFIDPLTSPKTVWFTNDGGVWKRQHAAAATAWLNENNSPLGTVQFQSIAVHATDANFTLGGTQDNGTEAQQTSPGTWVSAEGGDGGFALIDQSTTGAVSVNMYHTFYNIRNAQIGFDRAELVSCLATKDQWEWRGVYAGQVASAVPSCDGTAFDQPNGIALTDRTNFYAPMALGPGSPNTLYFGTDRLYRSSDRGDTMTVVNTGPTFSGVVPVSAIGIAPSNDAVRLVGLNTGLVFGTITGTAAAGAMTNISPVLPANVNGTTTKYISRAVIDPSNANTAYVSLSYYRAAAGQGIFKTTNLDQTAIGTVTWTASGSGIPNVPINAFVIDPATPTRLFAGTDIGVYVSFDSGATWHPFGTGLPRVAVFDMAIAKPNTANEILRIATHGRGMWEIPLLGPTAAPAVISGRITTPDGSPVAGVTVNLSGKQSTKTITDANGNYRFDNIDTDNFYTVTPALSNYQFAPSERSFSLLGNKTDAVFTATLDAVVLNNAIDSADYFVRQQYLDFLGREPDESGFNFWSNQIDSCGSDTACGEQKRINVSAAYFLSIEFQQTGGLVDGLYRLSYGRPPTFAEFMPDSATIAQNVIVGKGDWASQLKSNREAFVEAWMDRAAFKAAYENLKNSAYIDALIANTRVNFSKAERDAFVSGLANNSLTRNGVLLQIVEDDRFLAAKHNEMFVMMEYFGYLRRDPDAAGYQFWLNKLNQFNGNFEQAEMVKAFIVSSEYRQRFSR